ncbi:MAG: hypothetical protein WED04_13500 [Promethearchaeati archaeon SRVP18_Atabeyarchaeia-1]
MGRKDKILARLGSERVRELAEMSSEEPVGNNKDMSELIRVIKASLSIEEIMHARKPSRNGAAPLKPSESVPVIVFLPNVGPVDFSFPRSRESKPKRELRFIGE